MASPGASLVLSIIVKNVMMSNFHQKAARRIRALKFAKNAAEGSR